MSWDHEKLAKRREVCIWTGRKPFIYTACGNQVAAFHPDLTICPMCERTIMFDLQP